MTEQADKYRQAAQQMNRLADKHMELDEEEAQTKDSIEQQLDTELKGFFNNNYVMSEHEEITKLSTTLSINASDARKQLNSFPDQYIVQEHNIPDLIRKMRKSRRALKGEQRIKMAKAIDTMIDAYSEHLNKCIDSIHWITPYKPALVNMRYNEKDLHKLYKMKDAELRRETVDALCKFWELNLEQKEMAYSKELIDHYEQPRNVGSLDKESSEVGTGLVGAPACGDVMKLQIKVNDSGVIEDAKFKTFGCGSAIASSSLITEWVKGKNINEANEIKNTEIAKHLALPPVKIHCSVLAEDAIKAAVKDYRNKNKK